ncbi:hypothetical protein CLOP_g18138 [Closterium sp. NIES-67]|nr:hypothetical protein CLOP_g18138 [Closterium sp. NIES-67]
MAFTPTSRVLLLALFAALVAVAYSQELDTFTAKLNGANEVYKNDDENFKLIVGNKSGKVVVKLEIHKERGHESGRAKMMTGSKGACMMQGAAKVALRGVQLGGWSEALIGMLIGARREELKPDR